MERYGWTLVNFRWMNEEHILPDELVVGFCCCGIHTTTGRVSGRTWSSTNTIEHTNCTSVEKNRHDTLGRLPIRPNSTSAGRASSTQAPAHPTTLSYIHHGLCLLAVLSTPPQPHRPRYGDQKQSASKPPHSRSSIILWIRACSHAKTHRTPRIPIITKSSRPAILQLSGVRIVCEYLLAPSFRPSALVNDAPLSSHTAR